jgi:hypothetical protein
MHINQDTDYIYLGEEPLKDAKYYGKMYFTDGSSYQGYFINGKKNGYGEEKNINGYTKGYYQENDLNGKALSFIKSKGCFIDGSYQNGKLNGECMFYDEKNVLQNRGMYKDGKSCVASYETINKTINGEQIKVYEGFVYEDKYNGFGKLYEDGKIYIGNFTTGRKDGPFLICYNNGHIVYSPQQSSNEIVIEIDKINKDNFLTFKNLIIFNNDSYDYNNKIVYKENNIIKYIGKLNSDMKYHDDSGVYYTNTNSYLGKFINGEFIGGTFNFNGGKYKGGFNKFSLNGNGIVEFDDGSKFEGEFENNDSKLGKYNFKFEGKNNSIDCKIKLMHNNFIFEFALNTKFNLDNNNRYEGNFIILKNNHIIGKLNLVSGKHYQNNKLLYEGEFKNFKYHGSGIKYHPNGNLNISGHFELGEPFKAEYYDEHGNLIFSDLDNFDNLSNYNEMPGLTPILQINTNIENNLIGLINNFSSDMNFINTNQQLIDNLQNTIQSVLQTALQNNQPPDTTSNNEQNDNES